MAETDFAAFVAWLDGGVAPEGAAYLDIHARLVAYFARKGCAAPEVLADETLSRAARRLHEEGTITNIEPARYCYVLARFVLLEYLRSPERKQRTLSGDVAAGTPEMDVERERALACLDRCLGELPPDDRALILEYYSGDRSSRMATRRRLADHRGASANALMIKASRLRNRIRECLGGCLERQVSGHSI